jgi:hypothetical protein
MRTKTQMWRMNAHTYELYRGNQWFTYAGLPPACLPDLPLLPILERDGDPVSLPSSPREPGEDEDEAEDEEWDWHYYDIIYIFVHDPCGHRTRSRARMNNHVRPRKIKQKKSKEMRINGRLKQPGGASCNQRR